MGSGIDSMKAAIEDLRSKIEENGTLKVVQSELTILREKLCESIDNLGSKLESRNNSQGSGSQDAHPEVSVYKCTANFVTAVHAFFKSL